MYSVSQCFSLKLTPLKQGTASELDEVGLLTPLRLLSEKSSVQSTLIYVKLEKRMLHLLYFSSWKNCRETKAMLFF